jgi:rubrerythrin
MSISFNADEIYEMAEEIERNGAVFYRQTAAKCKDKETKRMLLNMADMEDGHLKTFQQMRTQLSASEKAGTVFDPDNEAVLYLQAMAEARGWEGRKSPAEQLTGNESMKEILEIALNSEKESVVFYFGLKSFVSEKAGKDKVEQIILEELSHVRTLLEHLKNLK